MAQPTLLAQLDWDDSGTFVQATDDITDRVMSFKWSRGRNADFSGEAMGQASLVLRNTDGYFTNLMDPAGTAALIPGRPLWVTGTYGGTAYGVFYGRVERVTADPVSRTVTVEAYDPLRQFSETPTAVASLPNVTRTARDYRFAVLEDAFRGNRNLVANPSFETNIAGWDYSQTPSATVARSTAAAYSGSASLSIGNGSASWIVESQVAYAPVFFANTTYRASAYVRAASGTVGVGFGMGTGSVYWINQNFTTATVGTAWQRLSVTFTPTATVAASNVYVGLSKQGAGAGTALLDAVSVTRGAELRPYADTGTGRSPNWIGNGNLDGSTDGWASTYTSFITNGNFETDTTGWTAVGGGSITRTGGTVCAGTASAVWTPTSSAYYMRYAITGTFKAGKTYRYSVWLRRISGFSAPYVDVSLASPTAGTALTTLDPLGTSWTQVTGTTTIGTADVTDMRFDIRTNATVIAVDLVSVIPVLTNRSSIYVAPSSGPGGNGSGNTTFALSTAVVKYGARTLSVTTAAGTAEGIVYDLNNLGESVLGAAPYTASLWLYPAGTALPYKVGLAGNKWDGTWDEATKSGTASANQWTQVTVTLTPSDAYESYAGRNVVYVTQTDSGTAHTFYLDGVRMVSGTAADDFERYEWNVSGGSAEALVTYPTALSLSGNATSLLSTLNDVAATRHWIAPQGTAPYYRYTAQDRTSFAALSTAETYANDFRLLDAQELDRSQIVNVVPVTWASATYYASDSSSVTTYGPRPTSALDASSYLTTATDAQSRADAAIAQYAAPRGRPTLEAVNRFPSVLARDVGDRVVVTYPALNISSRSYTILNLEGEVRSGGAEWVVRYGLEEYPY